MVQSVHWIKKHNHSNQLVEMFSLTGGLSTRKNCWGCSDVKMPYVTDLPYCWCGMYRKCHIGFLVLQCWWLLPDELPPAYRLVLSHSPEIFRNKRSCPAEGRPRCNLSCWMTRITALVVMDCGCWCYILKTVYNSRICIGMGSRVWLGWVLLI